MILKNISKLKFLTIKIKRLKRLMIKHFSNRLTNFKTLFLLNKIFNIIEILTIQKNIIFKQY